MKEKETNEKAIEVVEDLELTSTEAEEVGGGNSAYPNFSGGVYVATSDLDYAPKATDVTLKRGVID